MKFTTTALSCICVAAAMAGAANGQTQIDLRTQGKNIDFSTAARTRPSKTGTSLPANCLVGETFLKTDAAAGRNSYVCTAANVWTVQGIEVPDPTGKADQALTTDGVGLSWQAFGGDVSGRAGAIIVTGLGGRRLGSLTPLDGQYMKWNGIAQQWEPTTLTVALSVFGRSGAVSAQTGDYNFSQISGTAGPSQVPALAGDVSGTITGTSVVRIQSRPVSATTPLTGQVITWDGAQWVPQSPALGVSSIFGRNGPVTAQAGDYSFSHLSGVIGASQLPAAGGDLSGSLSAPTVAKVQGRTVSSTAPSSGQVLTWSGTQWTPQAPSGLVLSVFGRVGVVTPQSGDYAFNQISGAVAAAQLPSAGGDLSGGLNAATVTRLQSRAISAAAPGSGQYLMWDGLQWAPTTFGGVTSTFGRSGAITSQYGDYTFGQIAGTVAAGQLPAAGGDLSGSMAAPSVAGLQNRPVSAMSPSMGQILGWDGAKWAPQTAGSGVTSTFGRTGAVTAQTGDYAFGQISGAASVGQLPAAGGDLNGTLTSARVTGLQNRPVATSVPSTGQVLAWDGAQWAPNSAAAGGVISTFGRTGAVTAQTGDYGFAQISGSVASLQLPTAGGDLSGALGTPTVASIQTRPVAATAPSTGQVLAWTGTQWAPQFQNGGVASVFGRTGAVTTQSGDYSFAQISGSVASAQLPSAGGDVSGTLTSSTVNKLQNRPLAATAPASGQVLGWDGTQWTPQTVVSGGGGGGANSIDKTVSNTYTAGAKQTFVPSLSTSGINVMPSTLPTNPVTGDVSLDSDDANKLKVYDGGQWNTLVTVSSYIATFTSQTVVTVNGTTHRLGTANVGVDCYDTANPAARVEPDKVVVTPVSFNISVYFATPQTGTCTLTGTGGVTSSATSGAGMASQLGDLGLVLTSPTVLTAGLNCSNATPCNARLGNAVYSVTNSSSVTLTAGSGTLYLYLDAGGSLVAGHNLTLSCSGVCGAVPGITAFPIGSIPLFSWTATNGIWDSNGGSDRRAFLSTRNLASGTGIVALDTGVQTIVAVDSASVPTYLTASAVVDFGSISPGSCGESTVALPGASTGDSVAPGWPAGLESGLIGMMRVSAANTVALRVCNLSGSIVDPAAATFRATVVRSF
ncbi:MAG: hypothetical protein ABI806_01285 [Candidatus Solibacter sp.]